MRNLLTTLFLFLATGVFQMATADILLPPFSPDQRKHWECKADARLESANSFPDNVPEVCGRLTFFKAKPDAKDFPYPGIVLNLNPKSGTPTDWSNVRKIRFNAYSDREDSLRLLVWNRKGQRSAFSIPFKQGRNKIELDFKMELELSDVKTLYLYRRLPPENWTLHLGTITLIEESAEKLKQKKEKLKAEFTALKGDFSALPEAGRKEAEQLRVRGDRIAANADGRDWKQLQTVVKDLTVLRQENSFRKEFLHSGSAAGWVSSMEKVRREKQHFIRLPQNTITLDAARGEGEGAQILLLSDRNYPAVAAKSTEIISADGREKIPSDALSLHPVGFVNCRPSTYYVNEEPPGWWPDPILTYAASVPMEAGNYQSWYLDLRIPEHQKPGLYHGKIYLSGPGFPEKILPYQVHVRKFSLRKGTPYLFAASLQVEHEGSLFNTFSEAEKERWRKQLFDLFLTHRVNPGELYSPPRPAEEHRYKLKNGADSFNIMYLTGGEGRKSLPSILKKLTPAVQELKQKGIYSKSYLYGFDEWPEKHHRNIEEICAGIKEKFPDLPIMTTTYDTDFGTGPVLRSVDLYCPTMPEYEKRWDKIKEARAKGKKILWYTAIGIGAPYPNFYIEYPQMDSRLILGVMFWKYRPDGFLYWALGRFFQNEKINGKWVRSTGRLIPETEAPLISWKPNSFLDANGEGFFTYPAANGPIPSLRLKALRDGLEDYMYFKKLSDTLDEVRSGRKKLPPAWTAAAEKELKVEPELVKSLSDYTKNPEILFRKRARIADLLDQAE